MARKKSLPPRRKRMKRLARLQAARHWLERSGVRAALVGRTHVPAYAKWFSVDLGCALKELRMLGAEIDEGYAQQLMTTLQNGNRPRASAPPSPQSDRDGYGEEWDDHFAHIAGFTPGGAPFGVSWEEASWLDEEPGALPPADGPPLDRGRAPRGKSSEPPDCPRGRARASARTSRSPPRAGMRRGTGRS